MGLSLEDRKLVGRDIQKVEFGWPLGMPYCRSLGKRPVGSAERPDGWKDCEGYFLRGAGPHGSAARLCQENAEDTSPGFGTRAKAYEGGALR